VSAAPVRVLIVDDSAVMRQLLAGMLSRDPGIEVVGTAADPVIARRKIVRLRPDVLTLDIEMPRMNGLEFLKRLMCLNPMPVVMISSLTERGAAASLQALALGAVDVVAKPKAAAMHEFDRSAAGIAAKVLQAARARVQARPCAAAPGRTLPALANVRPVAPDRPWARLLAIGASAGGTEAIRQVLEAMPANAPPIVIVQHIPGAFSRPFIERLDRYSPLRVVEARSGAPLLPGHAYLPPPDLHLGIARGRDGLECAVIDGGPVNHHCPSVDVLFHSVARHAGARAVGALLTGMGDDGARGLLAMRKAGAGTLVQDEATSVVWGMPGAAVRMRSADTIVPLPQIAARMLALASSAAGTLDAPGGQT